MCRLSGGVSGVTSVAGILYVGKWWFVHNPITFLHQLSARIYCLVLHTASPESCPSQGPKFPRWPNRLFTTSPTWKGAYVSMVTSGVVPNSAIGNGTRDSVPAVNGFLAREKCCTACGTRGGTARTVGGAVCWAEPHDKEKGGGEDNCVWSF